MGHQSESPSHSTGRNMEMVQGSSLDFETSLFTCAHNRVHSIVHGFRGHVSALCRELKPVRPCLLCSSIVLVDVRTVPDQRGSRPNAADASASSQASLEDPQPLVRRNAVAGSTVLQGRIKKGCGTIQSR